jgi:hypothetical protein
LTLALIAARSTEPVACTLLADLSLLPSCRSSSSSAESVEGRMKCVEEVIKQVDATRASAWLPALAACVLDGAAADKETDREAAAAAADGVAQLVAKLYVALIYY